MSQDSGSEYSDSDAEGSAAPRLRPLHLRPSPPHKDAEDNSDDELITEDAPAGANEYAGGGRLGIPQAMASLEPPLDGMREGKPPLRVDLRRHVLAGDIVNMLGGNKWGHMVLLLAVRVFEFRELLDVTPLVKKDERVPAAQVIDRDVSIFFLRVLQSASNMADINFSTIGVVVHPDTKDLCMVRVALGCAQLCTGVDGLPMVAEILMSPFGKDLDVGLLQEAVKETRSADQNTKWSKGTAVRSYLRKAELAPRRYATPARKQKLAGDLRASWLARPICSTVPARVWQHYLHRRSRLHRDDLPNTNEVGDCMVRGVGRGSHLLYCGQPGGVPAERWCGTCADASADGTCGPERGPQCAACLEAQGGKASDDPVLDIAFVEDVLRIMPVKDDRVLPEELSRALVATRLWKRVDLRKRPPRHRR